MRDREPPQCEFSKSLQEEPRALKRGCRGDPTPAAPMSLPRTVSLNAAARTAGQVKGKEGRPTVQQPRRSCGKACAGKDRRWGRGCVQEGQAVMGGA